MKRILGVLGFEFFVGDIISGRGF